VELCLEAIKKWDGLDNVFKYVPESIRDKVKKAAGIKPSKQEKGK
jgi:hypothetical protein